MNQEALHYCLISIHPASRLVVKKIAVGAGGLGFNSRAGEIRRSVANGSPPLHVSSELRCPGAKPRECASLVGTRLGVIPRV